MGDPFALGAARLDTGKTKLVGFIGGLIMTDLSELLAEYGAASWDKQECLAEFIGDGDWQLDVSAGLITFGGKHTFPVQILGTEGDATGTWLWSWANVQSGLPEPLLAAAKQLQAYGSQNQVRELTESEVSLEVASGHLFSLIASGLCEADAYYRGPYEGGAVFLLLNATPLQFLSDDSPLRFIRVFNEFISAFSCRHETALRAYAHYKGYSVASQQDDVIVTLPAGAEIHASFDTLGRLAELKSVLNSQNIGTPPEKKSWWKLGR
jgi:hypothetical protein